MASLLVAYDLVGTDSTSDNYSKLIDAIKGYPDWCHVQDSVWVIKSSASATTVRDALRQYMHPRDRLFVAGLTGAAAWTAALCADDALKRVLSG